MDREAHRDLRVLEAVQQDSRLTQRGLANKLGMALGLANVYLKRMIHKGYIKCVNVQPNRISYLITPRGIAEKTRLTYEFMDYSLHLYGQVRQHLRDVLEPLSAGERQRVAIYGSGEAAELAYLCIVELGLDLVAVFDDEADGTFLGKAVREVRDRDAPEFDVLIVATLDKPKPIIERLVQCGVPAEKLVCLRDARRNQARQSAASGQ